MPFDRDEDEGEISRQELAYLIREDLAERAWSIATGIDGGEAWWITVARLRALELFTGDALRRARQHAAREGTARTPRG